jgi:hypothetical protein
LDEILSTNSTDVVVGKSKKSLWRRLSEDHGAGWQTIPKEDFLRLHNRDFLFPNKNCRPNSLVVAMLMIPWWRKGGADISLLQNETT